MNKFKKTLYDITRIYVKKYLTGNLGKVVEDDEKITCYVKKSKVKKKDYNYTIACFGIGEDEDKKKIAKAFKLDKPIRYIIDDLELNKHKVYIFGYNDCEVIIKNCSFGLNLCVHVNGKCTLDNTDIKTFSHLSISANELVIKNMSSDQIEAISPKSHIGFGANDKIDVIDSNVGNKNKNIKVSFTATNGLNITNSNITGKEVEWASSVINVNESSSLTAADKVALKTNDFNPININAPIIVLNGEEIANEKETVVLKKINDPLSLKRLELVNLLKRVKNECESINSEKVSEYKEELDVQPISKVLKR